MIARWAAAGGSRVAVLSRGYGGCYAEKVVALSDGGGPRADSRVSGDEPIMLANNLPGVPVVLSGQRYLAGIYAQQRFGSDFFILDDGFQHVALERDLDLVLVDADDPFGNGCLLPRGPLREPVRHLERAHAFIVTRWRDTGDVARPIGWIRRRFPTTPVFFAQHRPARIVFPDSDRSYGPEYIDGKRVAAFAGIARPDAFRRTLVELGARVVHFEGFEDHHAFEEGEVAGLTDTAMRAGADCLLTTEKDWWRLDADGGRPENMGYLKIEFRLAGREAEFFQFIHDRARTKGVV
jgi:tetraacyldisaccharide 4'-kinase